MRFLFPLASLGFAFSALLFLRGWRRTARAIWALTICLVSLPFESFQTHAHWDKIGWIPFYSWPVRPLDVVGNIALYMPLGYLAVDRATKARSESATKPRRREKIFWIALQAFVLSLTMEVIQDFSHSRFPSATDLVCNVAGALLGYAIARRASTNVDRT